MTERDPKTIQETADTIAKLKTVFVETPTYLQLREQFLDLHSQRVADLKEGNDSECTAIILTGPPGSGKTQMTKRLTKFVPEIRSDKNDRYLDVVRVRAPSTTTVLNIGKQILGELEHPYTKGSNQFDIWDQIETQFRQRRVKFLIIDETHDLIFNHQGREILTALSTLKSLLNSIKWPVNLLLAGTPELTELVALNGEVNRRKEIIEIPKLSWAQDGENIPGIVEYLAAKAGLAVSDDLRGQDFGLRLFHAAQHKPGLAFKFVVESIRPCLRVGDETLTRNHFAQYARRNFNCLDGLNPFLAPDFRDIGVRAQTKEDENSLTRIALQRALARWKKTGS